MLGELPPRVTVTVRDDGIVEPVWEKDFDTITLAETYLMHAGWEQVPGEGWQQIQPRFRSSDHYAISARPDYVMVRTRDEKVLWEIPDSFIGPVRLAVHAVVINREYGYAFEAIDEEGNLQVDPVFSMLVVPPVKIQAVGVWKYPDQAIEAGEAYFTKIQNHFGDLFDEALRANILRNYSGGPV